MVCQSYVQLAAQFAPLLPLALPACKASLFKQMSVYNVINLVPAVLQPIQANALLVPLALIFTLVNVYLAVTLYVSIANLTINIVLNVSQAILHKTELA